MLPRLLIGGLILSGYINQVQPQDSLANRFGLSAGLGVTVIHAIDVVDYINSVSASTNRLDDFASAAEFFGTFEFYLKDSWGGKLEYVYLLKSYTVDQGPFGIYEYFYAVHMPMLMLQYLDVHPGYAFKFGGGLGYHIAVFSERIQGASSRDWQSSGLGLKFEAEGNTALGEHLYGYLAGDVRLNFMGILKDSQGVVLQIQNPTPRNVRMNFFAFGLKFGLIFYF